jgi:hypothetical protein
MSYKFTQNGMGGFDLELDKVEGTHHTNLQNAILYKSAPTRDTFCQKIVSALARDNA